MKRGLIMVYLNHKDIVAIHCAYRESGPEPALAELLRHGGLITGENAQDVLDKLLSLPIER